jgi:hypothetical protein
MKNWLIEKIKGNEKIISAALTIPVIAAGTMSGACAAGCPYGLVNDPYPGQCPRYIDVTGNGICDLSQASVASSSSSAASNPTTTSNSHTANSSDQSASTGESQNTSNIDQNDSTNASAVSDQGSGFDNSIFGESSGYYVLPVSFLLLGGYLFTHYLFSKGILSQKKHRRIWNLLVTAGYIGTGVTGVFLTLMINLGIRTALNPSITFLHAELAIVIVIGTLIHMHIYRKPLKRMLKVLLGFNSGSKKNVNKNTGRSK